MAHIVISENIEHKLAYKHSVTPQEVHECFTNRCGKPLEDPREQHRTDPPTLWFIAETNCGRKLKVIFILDKGKIYLRSAFPPDANEIRIYEKYGQ
ncbi:MAG: hypothetical protein K0M66_11070 [Thiobacillus sp.]|nr:hypothetical protein [Thiobacillus sp.]